MERRARDDGEEHRDTCFALNHASECETFAAAPASINRNGPRHQTRRPHLFSTRPAATLPLHHLKNWKLLSRRSITGRTSLSLLVIVSQWRMTKPKRFRTNGLKPAYNDVVFSRNWIAFLKPHVIFLYVITRQFGSFTWRNEWKIVHTSKALIACSDVQD